MYGARLEAVHRLERKRAKRKAGFLVRFFSSCFPFIVAQGVAWPRSKRRDRGLTWVGDERIRSRKKEAPVRNRAVDIEAEVFNTDSCLEQ